MANNGFGDEPQKSQSTGVILPLLAVASVGVVAWKGFEYLDKIRSNKEIDKASANIAQSTANIIKSKAKVEQMEQKALVTGVNGFGKLSTSNYVTQAKEVIDGLLTSIPDKYGIKKYFVKPEPNGTKVKNALFETPVIGLDRLKKIYNIYTQRTLIDDLQKLDSKNYALIKALLNASNKQKK